MARAKGQPVAVVIGPVDDVRPLARAGIRCHVVAPPGAIVRFSRHVAGTLPWVDPQADPEGFVATLLEFAARQSEPPVLFCGGDFDLLAVSRARQRLASRFRFLLAAPDLIEDLVDKRRFLRRAEQLGLPTPRGQVATSGDLAAGMDIGLPVIVKPVTRDDRRWMEVAHGAKVLELRSPDQVARALERLEVMGIDVLIQEIVPGPEQRVLSYHVYVSADGVRVAEFTGRKVRTYPRSYGHSTALEIVDLPEVRDLGRDVVSRLGLVGVAKLDFKQGPDGRLYLLEVNPRFTLWNHPGALAGVDLPTLVFSDLTGRPRPKVERSPAVVRWCDPLPDARAAMVEHLGVMRWLRWYASAEAKAAFDPGDPGPVAWGAAWRLARGIGRGRSRSRATSAS